MTEAAFFTIGQSRTISYCKIRPWPITKADCCLNYGANVVVGAVVVVGAAVVQQSEVALKKLGQLSVPHSRFPAQSSSPSQSPSKSPHGFELEQHDHVSSVDQLHPAKLGSRSKNEFDNMSLH
jgi:hypothetical protein